MLLLLGVATVGETTDQFGLEYVPYVERHLALLCADEYSKDAVEPGESRPS